MYHPSAVFRGLIEMPVQWLLQVSCCFVAFVRDFQTLIAGLIAIMAALITARPVWRQLDRMSVQTGTMYRDFLADRLKALQGRRKWLFDKIEPFEQEVSQRMYEMREIENRLNIHWVFDRAQTTAILIRELETYRATNRDSSEMAEAVASLVQRLKALEENLDTIHRPDSTDQSGEDWSYTDEQWTEIRAKAEAADAALDGIVNEFEAASKQLRNVVDGEIGRLRDRVKVTDDALMHEKL